MIELGRCEYCQEKTQIKMQNIARKYGCRREGIRVGSFDFYWGSLRRKKAIKRCALYAKHMT